MIRLAVIGGTQKLWQEIAPRLRGVILSTGGATADCTAVLVDAAAKLATATMEGFLREGKQVMVTATGGLPRALFDDERLLIANPDRYLPSRQLIRQQLDAGKLGAPGLLRLHRWGQPDSDPESSLLRDLHTVLWYFGTPPERVYAVGNTLNIHAHLGFPGGGMALVDNMHMLASGAGYHSLSLIGSAGAAYADDHQNMQLRYHPGSAPQSLRTEEGVLAVAALVQDFADGIAAGRDASAQRTAWRQVLCVYDAVQESKTTRQAVPLTGGAP